MIALGEMEQDITGNTTGHVAGFAASPTSPTSLTINLAAGRVYQQSSVDSTAWGALPSDTAIIQQQGAAAAQQVTLTTSALSAGQSQWALIQAQFSQVDAVANGDPTGGLLFFYNSANPSQPFQGPGNNQQIQNTTRLGAVSIEVIYGSPATTGSEVPPQPMTGWIGLYLVDLTFGQTTISSGQILVAGPSVGTGVPSNYPGAPFVAGLLNQHHLGIPGQAPQIDLTAEVKNVLPLSHHPASDTTGGGLPVMKLNAGNPNGSVAGNANVNGASDLCWDTTDLILYICTTTGTTSSAVWTSVVGSSTSQFAGGTSTGTANAQVVASTTPAGFAKTPGQVVTFTVGSGLSNTGSTTLNVDSTGASLINKNTGSGNVPLTGGELTAGSFVSVIWTGTVYLLQSQSLGALATLGIGQWLQNVSGNLTIKNGAVMGDDGNGNFTTLPQFLVPIGAAIPYAGSSSPYSNWAICNGAAVSRTTYATLFGILGITFGSGDGITTFNLPDLRGRVVAGVDGGANRLTTATQTSQTLGGNGGAELIALTLAQIPVHNHGINDPSHAHGYQEFSAGSGTVGGGGAFGANIAGTTNSATTGITTQNAGSGSSHPNVQPTMQLNYLIRLS